MIKQDAVWLMTLAGVGLVALAFVYVIIQSGKPADSAQVQKSAYAIRRWWFLVLAVFGIGVTYAQLEAFPHRQSTCAVAHGPDRHGGGAPVVLGFDTQSGAGRDSGGVPGDQCGCQSRLRDLQCRPAGCLETQTQAMPGVTNRLVHTFTEPGKYRILCLEYCGLAHHGMMAELEVVAADNGGRP